MLLKIRRFMKGRRGQGMSEYIIMVGLVAVAAIGIYTAFGKVTGKK
jgi:Flp pilus assembly pilin Flp